MSIFRKIVEGLLAFGFYGLVVWMFLSDPKSFPLPSLIFFSVLLVTLGIALCWAYIKLLQLPGPFNQKEREKLNFKIEELGFSSSTATFVVVGKKVSRVVYLSSNDPKAAKQVEEEDDVSAVVVIHDCGGTQTFPVDGSRWIFSDGYDRLNLGEEWLLVNPNKPGSDLLLYKKI